MNFDSLLTGGLLIGVLAACWSYVKLLLWRICSLFVVRVRLEGEMARSFAYLCWHKFSRSPFGEYTYRAKTEFVKPAKRSLVVGFEVVGTDPVIFWRNWRPVVVNWGSTGVSSSMGLIVTTLRGFFDLEQLLIEALDLYNKRTHEGDEKLLDASRFFVEKKFGRRHRVMAPANASGSGKGEPLSQLNEVTDVTLDRRTLKWKPDELGWGRPSIDAFAGLSFPPEVEEMVKTASRWLASEKWYAEKKIPWRMGWLLYGQPGTGKTSLVKALGLQLNMPVIVFDLATFGNEDFNEEWQRALGYAPCIILLEDIDAVFKGRENRQGGPGGLTFDCLLNCMSGVQDANGVFVVVTTNNVDDLDEALGKPTGDGSTLSTRPGRIDRALELKPMTEACRRVLAQRILSDCPELVEEQVKAGANDTAAQFQERCAQLALAHHWR